MQERRGGRDRKRQKNKRDKETKKEIKNEREKG